MASGRLIAILIPSVVLAGTAGVIAGVHYKDDILATLTSQPAGATTSAVTPETTAAKTLWTCGMHPQIIREGPGLCPICHMPLVEMHVHNDPANGITIDPTIVQNMGVRTAHVEQGQLRQRIHAVGTLTEPEQNHLDINLRVNGWIRTLYANQEGMLVSKGDPLFDFYSPEITAAADELIAARQSAEMLAKNPGVDPVMAHSSDAILAAGKRKLELMGLTTEQVDAIALLDKSPATLTITSPIHGHVAAKMVIEGSAIHAGDRLMEIADNSTMWLQVQVFEQQLGRVALGDKVHANLVAVPGKDYEGTVDFVYPHLDTATRTAMVRVVLANADHRLHENMYATAEIETSDDAPALLVPREAVIDSGVRQIVFLSEGKGHFAARQVTLGHTGRREPGDPEMVQVLTGLTADDIVVTSGQFLLDSESRMQEATQKFLNDRDNKPTTIPVIPAVPAPAMHTMPEGTPKDMP